MPIPTPMRSNNTPREQKTSKQYKLFVGSVPGEATEEKLRKLFSQFGEIKTVDLPFKSGKKVNAGYCKLSCKNESTFNALLNNTVMYKKRVLEIRPHLSDQALAKFRQGYNQRRVYVYNINPQFSDKEIMSAFDQNIGPVDSGYCIRKNDFQRKRKNVPMFGYVLFKSEEDANKAITQETLIYKECKIRIKKYTPNAGTQKQQK